jgi:hypothetical protein
MIKTLAKLVTAALLVSAAVATAPIAAGAGTAPTLTQRIGDFETGSEGWTLNLGGEFPGAKGAFALDNSTAVTGASSGKLSGDFGGGGQYVAIGRGFSPLDLSSLGFSVRSADLATLALRLTDSTGQVHQQRLTLNGSTNWQHLDVTTFAGGDQYVHFGGANDGVWHGPAQAISFILDRNALHAGLTAGSLWIDDVTAVYPAPAVALSTTTLGNVFTLGQRPAIRLTSGGDAVSWTATDVGGNVVASGQRPVTAVNSTLVLPIDRIGWFRITVTAKRAGAVIGTAETTLALLTKFDTSKVNSSPFGTGGHFGQGTSTDPIPLIASAGIKTSRDEMMWQNIEPTKGSYVFPQTEENFAGSLIQNSVAPLIVLDYANPNYDGGKAPTSPEGIAAFANYADALATHYAGKVSNYEIWNEWNIGSGDTDRTPRSYFALQKKTYETVKAHHPNVTVVAPALAGADMQWIEQWLQLGGLQYTDAVSFHPYLYPAAPEALDATLTQLQDLIKKYNGGKPKPVWITEQGWPTGTAGLAVSEPIQAAYLTRAQLIALSHGVQRYHNYDFVNDGTDPGNTENNFGLIRHPADALGAYTPKPSYVSYATLTRQLTGATFRNAESTGTGVHDLVFTRRDETVRTLWADTPTVVSVHSTEPLTVTDLYGAAQTYTPDSTGVVTLSLTGDPIYVSGPATAVTSGARYALTAASGFVGDPLQAVWTVDNTGSRQRADVTLALGGHTYRQTVPAGQTGSLTINLPAPTAPGTRSLIAEVSVKHSRVGRLRADLTVQNALQLQAKHVIDNSGAQQLRLTVSNQSASSHTLGSLAWTLGSTSGTALAGATVPSGGQQVVDLPLSGLTTATRYPYTATLTATGQPTLNTSGTVIPVDASSATKLTKRTITVDGKLDDLTGVPGIQLPADGKVVMNGYGGPSDLSGTAWFTYDAQNLYLSARLTDDRHAQPATGGNIWLGDSIQFAVGSGAPGEQSAWSEIGVALTSAGPQLYRWQAYGESAGSISGASVAVTRDETAKQTTYEVAIPWSHLQPIHPDDRLISLSMLVNDNDGAGRKGWIEWGSGIGGAKDPSLFKAAQLAG